MSLAFLCLIGLIASPSLADNGLPKKFTFISFNIFFGQQMYYRPFLWW